MSWAILFTSACLRIAASLRSDYKKEAQRSRIAAHLKLFGQWVGVEAQWLHVSPMFDKW